MLGSVTPSTPEALMGELRYHELKTWPEYFQAIWDRRKTFEVRVNDRGFTVGDTLILKEWDPETGKYTGSAMMRTVTYVMLGGSFGIDAGTVVMGLGEHSQKTAPDVRVAND